MYHETASTPKAQNYSSKKIFHMVARGWIFVAIGSHGQTGRRCPFLTHSADLTTYANWLVIMWTRFWKIWRGGRSKSKKPGPPWFPCSKAKAPEKLEVHKRKAQAFHLPRHQPHLFPQVTAGSIIGKSFGICNVKQKEPHAT